ncbi:hypothetical protein [Actinomycetospora callitridis]|uniref:hypothetical protein n=1 Tax=Actinomycetospora callitridis TaxID=913944 RepID=UPI00236559E9|nr:hypothetical protein [Actinomycetospora callitridis]MDD7917030.1 hypothetical protein [Actinomycetospora callitridis]
MLVVYGFTRIAVVVRRWFEISPEAVMEHGARIELRLLTPQEHRGSESAAQPTVVDEAFWRADLFDRLDRYPGEFSAAHLHPFFEGDEPSDRVWSAELTADPWGWLADQLSDVRAWLEGAGLDPALAADDADAVRAAVPQIVATARTFGPEHRMSRDEDFRLTRDAAERVRRMVALIPEPTSEDREYLRPWLEQR